MEVPATGHILVVLAHPDDEAGLSGTLAKYAAGGRRVDLICATRGEVGEISDGALATRENLGRVRERELREAARLLGIYEVHLLGYRDSGMPGTPENLDPRSLNRAEPERVIGQIVGAIRRLRPEIIITFEPWGAYGHPDHVKISRCTTEAFHQAGDPQAYPEAGPVWDSRRLYYVVFPRFLLRRFRSILQAAGEDTSWMDALGDRATRLAESLDDQITHEIDVSEHLAAKMRAMRAHRTQFGPGHPFLQIPEASVEEVFGREYFIQVQPAPSRANDTISGRDLLAR